jgi:putative transposase
MAGKYLSLNLHMIWSTKQRVRLINPEWRSRLHAFMGSVAIAKKARLIEAQSQMDHIHLYASLPSTITVAEFINAMKANSTRWIHQNFPNRRFFAWQEGYGAFGVGRSEEKSVIEYIRKQDEHHKRRNFKEEFIEFLQQHEIEYDPRYVFD